LVRHICFVLAVVTLLLYWPVHDFQFNNYDDAQYLTQNPHVQNGLSVHAIGWAFSSTYAGNWHPLTWISHLIDVQVFGFNAGGHHFTNLLFHIANTLLLFLLWRRLTGALWRPALVAALFAWHPLHVESVAWVAERKDVLSAFFWMLTSWCYVRYTEEFKTDGSKSKLLYGLSLLCFVGGLMSKPMVVSLPLVLLLLDFWPLERFLFPLNLKQVFRLILEKTPFFLLSAASCVMTLLAQKAGGAVQPLTNLSLGDRLANSTVSFARYLGKLFCPIDLAVLYPFTRQLPFVEVLSAALLLVLIFGLALRLARTQPPLFVGWLWFFITLVPVIGFVQVGEQSMADRYTYIPAIGLFVLVAWEVPRLFDRVLKSNFFLRMGVPLLMIACLADARHQLGYWQNSITLFTRATQVATNNVFAECNLGLAYDGIGQLDQALLHERRAVEINPFYSVGQNNLAVLLEKKGQWNEAAEHLQTAIKDHPAYDEAYYNLGLIALHQGHPDEAILRFETALRVNPQYDKAAANLGIALAEQGRLDEAIAQYQRALDIAPHNAFAHNALGRAWESRNRWEDAAAQYEAAIRFKPDFAEAHENLGVVLALLGSFARAEAEFVEAMRLQPGSASIHFNFGNALLRQDKLTAAAAQYSEALRLQPGHQQAKTNLAIVWRRLGHNQP